LRLWDSLLASGRARKEFLSTHQGVPQVPGAGGGGERGAADQTWTFFHYL
jgi:hypothetical protein